MIFYTHYIGDYARDTGGLSIMEHGAYRLLLDHVYATEDRLPDDRSECYRIAKAMTPAERKAVDKVLDRFFPVNGDGRRYNKRAEEEIDRARNLMQDDEERKKNERERQRRHRERRARLFEQLRAQGVIPRFDATTEELERLLNGDGVRDVTRTVTPPVTPPVTVPVTVPVTPPVTRDITATTPTSTTRPTEELKTSPADAGEGRGAAATVPDCPHQKLIDLYHELLPTCPRVARWNEARQALMRARWREEARPRPADDHAGYTTVEGGLNYWRSYFDFVSRSRFLTGLTDGRNGQPPFVATLEWLIRPKNFAKVMEGNYHR